MIEQAGARLAEISWAGLSPVAREKLKLCVIANVSAAVAGVPYVRLPEPQPARGHEKKTAAAHLLFSGRRVANTRDAAFWNAAVMHARTQDDMNPVCNLHAGTVVIPAAIAAAENAIAIAGPAAVSGAAFLDAVAAGYTAASGLSRSFNQTTTPKGLRSTGLYMPFGAAAAAGRIAGLDATGIGNAIALAASCAAGLSQCWIDGSDEWQLHVAQAAANGLLAVTLTQRGVRGGAHALDGSAGFYRAYAGSAPTSSSLIADLDADRAVIETLLKRYPVSGIVQPVAYLAERIAAEHAPDCIDIARVRIAMNPFEMRYPGTLNKGPFASFSAVLMSVPFACASVLAKGRFEFSDLWDRNRPERDRLIAATEVSDDPALPSLSCRIELVLADGARITDAIPDGGKEAGLAIDASSIEAWARSLWLEAGCSAATYAAFRSVVDTLEHGTAQDLLATLPGGTTQ